MGEEKVVVSGKREGRGRGEEEREALLRIACASM